MANDYISIDVEGVVIGKDPIKTDTGNSIKYEFAIENTIAKTVNKFHVIYFPKNNEDLLYVLKNDRVLISRAGFFCKDGKNFLVLKPELCSSLYVVREKDHNVVHV